jgi:ferredoxin
MALKIISRDCISCGVCLPVCPNNGISVEGGHYKIDPQLCTECVGKFSKPQCEQVCPVGCIEPAIKRSVAKRRWLWL